MLKVAPVYIPTNSRGGCLLSDRLTIDGCYQSCFLYNVLCVGHLLNEQWYLIVVFNYHLFDYKWGHAFLSYVYWPLYFFLCELPIFSIGLFVFSLWIFRNTLHIIDTDCCFVICNANTLSVYCLFSKSVCSIFHYTEVGTFYVVQWINPFLYTSCFCAMLVIKKSCTFSYKYGVNSCVSPILVMFPCLIWVLGTFFIFFCLIFCVPDILCNMFL